MFISMNGLFSISMRILHIDSGLEWRGGQRQAYLLIEGLAGCGHEQYVAVPGRSPMMKRLSERLSDCVTIIKINPRLGGGIPTSQRLRSIVSSESIDMCAVHDSHGHHVAALMTLGKSGLPVVVHRRVDFPMRGNLLSRWKYLKGNIHYIAISNGVKDVLVEDGINPNNINIVHSCFDPRRWQKPKDGSTVRREFNIPANVPVIGNVAALVDHKGHKYLIEAAPQTFESIPDAHIIIVGEGDEYTALENQINDLGLNDRVHLAGWRRNIGDFLDAFDLFVLPSHLEGLCTSLLDAMYNHVPVVASKTGGIPDIVVDGETGLLVPPKDSSSLADAIIRVLKNSELMDTFKQNARQFVETDFTPQQMVKKTEKIYTEIVNRKK